MIIQNAISPTNNLNTQAVSVNPTIQGMPGACFLNSINHGAKSSNSRATQNQLPNNDYAHYLAYEKQKPKSEPACSPEVMNLFCDVVYKGGCIDKGKKNGAHVSEDYCKELTQICE